MLKELGSFCWQLSVVLLIIVHYLSIYNSGIVFSVVNFKPWPRLTLLKNFEQISITYGGNSLMPILKYITCSFSLRLSCKLLFLTIKLFKINFVFYSLLASTCQAKYFNMKLDYCDQFSWLGLWCVLGGLLSFKLQVLWHKRLIASKTCYPKMHLNTHT